MQYDTCPPKADTQYETERRKKMNGKTNLRAGLIISVFLLATLAGSAFADTVIQNGGFEAGLDGWQTDFEGRVGTDVVVEVIDVTARWGMSRPAGPNCAYLQRYEWYGWPPGATQYPTKAEISQAIYVPESAQSLKFDVAAMASAVPLTYHTFFEVVFQDQEGSSHQLYYIYWDLLDWIPVGPFPFNWYTDFMSEEIDISIYAGQSGYLIFRMREPSGPQFIQFIGVLVDDVRVEIVPPPPTLISPSNGSNVSGSSVQFCWNAATGANNYHLQIATDSSFNNIVYDLDVGNITCNVEVSNFPDDGTTFYWHVKAGSAAGWSDYSEIWSFVNGPSSIPDVPILSSPASGSNAAGTTVQLQWNASPRANNYHLQVATDSEFSNTVFDGEIGNYVTVNMSDFPDNGTTFYWRVKAGNALGWSSYSDTWSFVNGPSSIPDAPILSSPANGSNAPGTTVQFRWNVSPRANNYHLQVATDSGFSNTVFDGEIGYYVGADVPGFPDDGTGFYWRVKAGNALGWSSYSDTWYFDNGTAPAPEPATNPSPADGATGVGINADLTWAAGTGATSHDVYFGTSITPVFVRNQTTTSYDPCTLDSNTTYYWRIDEVGTSGTTTGIIWSFTTQVEPDPDLNNDGIVNFLDVAVLACYWRCVCSQPEWCTGADIDWSGGVDYRDLADIGAYWLEQITFPCQASYPDPCDGATGIEIDAMLTWTAGPLAILHDVYFGTNFADVINGTGGTFKTSQPETFYDPSPLNYSTSYYWRIDEVDPNSPTCKGKVWGFTTGP